MKKFLLVLMGLYVAGCATAPKISKPPAHISKLPLKSSHKLPSTSDLQAQHLVKNTYFGASSSKKGSLFMGLLMGPLGVAINAASIKGSASKAAKFDSFIGLDLNDLLLANQFIGDDSDLTPFMAVTPGALIYLIDKNKFQLSCIINTSAKDIQNTPWSYRYSNHMDKIYNKSSPSLKDDITFDLKSCFQEMFDIYRNHVQGKYFMSMKSAEIKTVDGFTIKMFAFRDDSTGDIISENLLTVSKLRKSGVKSFKYK